MTKLKMTNDELLKDLLLTYIRKIRMNILLSVKDLDDFEEQVERRFKKCQKKLRKKN